MNMCAFISPFHSKGFPPLTLTMKYRNKGGCVIVAYSGWHEGILPYNSLDSISEMTTTKPNAL